MLLSGASIVSRKEVGVVWECLARSYDMCWDIQVDCLKARDIHGWLEQIPQAYVTLIFDCLQNFVASFGKQRDPEVVDIMEDPWSVLTNLNSSTVIYYLRPDITAMARLQDRDEVKSASGLLTEGVNQALPHLRKSFGTGGSLSGICHMTFYETLSFYWHKKGRRHKAFVPAVAVSEKDLPLNQEFL